MSGDEQVRRHGWGARPMTTDEEATVAVAAGLRGIGPGLPRRFRAGEMHLSDAGLVWHPHRGRVGVALDRQLIRLRDVRPTRRGDGAWGSGWMRRDRAVLVLDYLGALIEVSVGTAELSLVRTALQADDVPRATPA